MVRSISRPSLFLLALIVATHLPGTIGTATAGTDDPKDLVDRLLNASRAGQADDRKAAISRLVALGDDAVPELASRLDLRPEEWVEDEIASILGAIRCAAATTALTQRLLDKNDAVRWKVVTALTGKPRALELSPKASKALCDALRLDTVGHAVASAILLAKDDHVALDDVAVALIERVRRMASAPSTPLRDTGYTECGYFILEFVAQWETRGGQMLGTLEPKVQGARRDASWPATGLDWLAVIRGNLGDRVVAEDMLTLARTAAGNHDLRALAVRALPRSVGERARPELEKLSAPAREARGPVAPPSHGARRDIVAEAAAEAIRVLDRVRDVPKEKEK